MEIEVLWDDMLWWLVNMDIIGECTASPIQNLAVLDV